MMELEFLYIADGSTNSNYFGKRFNIFVNTCLLHNLGVELAYEV